MKFCCCNTVNTPIELFSLFDIHFNGQWSQRKKWNWRIYTCTHRNHSMAYSKVTSSAGMFSAVSKIITVSNAVLPTGGMAKVDRVVNRLKSKIITVSNAVLPTGGMAKVDRVVNRLKSKIITVSNAVLPTGGMAKVDRVVNRLKYNRQQYLFVKHL